MRKLGSRKLGLFLALLSGVAFAQGRPSGGTDGLPLPTQSSLSTQAAMNLYVDLRGSDNNACTSGAGAACLTVMGAINKVPKQLRDPVNIFVDAGTWTAAQSATWIQGFTTLERDAGLSAVTSTSPILQIKGQRAVAAPATGPATGSVISAVQGSIGGGQNNAGTWGSITTFNASGWTTNDLQGRWLNITGGTGSGQIRAIASNDAGVITIAGGFDTAPDGTSTYELDDCGTILTTGGLPLPASTWTNAWDPLIAPPAGAAATVLVSNNQTRSSIGPQLQMSDVCFNSTDGTGAIMQLDDHFSALRVKYTNSAARKLSVFYPIGGQLWLDNVIGVFNANQRFVQAWAPDVDAQVWPQGGGGGMGGAIVAMRRSAIFEGVSNASAYGIYAFGGTVDSQQNYFFGGQYGIITGSTPSGEVVNTTGDHFEQQSATSIYVSTGTSPYSAASVGIDGDVFQGTGTPTPQAIRTIGTGQTTINFGGSTSTITSYTAGVALVNPAVSVLAIAANGGAAVLPTQTSVTCEFSILNATCGGATTTKAAIEAFTPLKNYINTAGVQILEYP